MRLKGGWGSESKSFRAKYRALDGENKSRGRSTLNRITRELTYPLRAHLREPEAYRPPRSSSWFEVLKVEYGSENERNEG